MSNEVLNYFSKLSELYPNRSFSEMYLALLDRVIEVLPSQNVSDDIFIKAIQFCLNVPEFLFADIYWGGEFYYIFKDVKIYKSKLYSFRIVGNKKKRYSFKYIWEEYSSLEDIISKCVN